MVKQIKQQTNEEKLIKRIEQNNYVLEATVLVDHINPEVAESVLKIANALGVKFVPKVSIKDKPVEVVEDPK